MATWLTINEPTLGLTDRSQYLHFGDPAGGLGPGEQTHWTQMLKQRGTADIALSIPVGDAYLPTIGCPIYLYDWDGTTSYLIFSGTIDSIETAWFDAEGNRIVGLSCVSFEQCFSVVRVYPGKLYQSMTCGAIFTDLLTLVAGWPGTTGRIDDGPIVDSLLLVDAPSISSVFDRLAIIANFVWSVDPETQEINFTAPGSVVAPWNVSATDVLWQQADIKVERHDFRDRQIIQIDYDQIGRSAECFAGTGQTVFNLRNPVHDVTGAWITKNTQNTATGSFSGQPSAGDLVTVGYPQTGSSYNWTASSPYFGNYQIIDPAGHLQTCINPGTSGLTQPTWNDSGGTTTDNTVTWQDEGLVGNGGLYAVATYQFVTALDNREYGQVLIGASAAATCQNLVDAINSNSSTRGIKYSLPTWENRLINADQPSGTTFTVRDKGPGKASIASLTSAGSAFSWSAAQTSGGVTTFGTTQITVGLATANNGGLGYTPGSPTVLLFHGPLNPGTTLCVEYHRIDGDLIAVENTDLVASVAATEHGTGKYQALTSDSTATPLRALAEIQAALEAFSVEPETFSFMTYRPGLKAGMLVAVNLNFPYGPSTHSTPIAGVKLYSQPGVGKCTNIGSPPIYPSGWETVGFNDSAWGVPVHDTLDENQPPFTGLPYGTAQWITDVNATRPASSVTLIRYPFTLTSATHPLTISIGADDYINAVYINGIAVPFTRSNATSPYGGYLWPPASAIVPITSLVVGVNIVAIELQNDTAPPPNPCGCYFQIVQGSETSWVIQEISGDLIPCKPTIGTFGHFRYTVRLINASQIGSYLDFWESLGGGDGAITSVSGASSGSGGQTITNATGTGIGGVNVQSASYTAAESDAGELISFTGAGAKTCTLPSALPSAQWVIDIENTGTGLLTVDPNGQLLDGAATTLSLSQNQGVSIFTDGVNYFTQRGMSGNSVSKYSTTYSAVTSATVTHGLGTTAVIVQCYDGSGVLFQPQEITVTSSTVVTLTFGVSFTGSVVVIG